METVLLEKMQIKRVFSPLAEIWKGGLRHRYVGTRARAQVAREIDMSG